jgi:hypothetical protein
MRRACGVSTAIAAATGLAAGVVAAAAPLEILAVAVAAGGGGGGGGGRRRVQRLGLPVAVERPLVVPVHHGARGVTDLNIAVVAIDFVGVHVPVVQVLSIQFVIYRISLFKQLSVS